MTSNVVVLSIAMALTMPGLAWAQQNPTGSWPSSGQFSTGSGCFQGGSATDGTYLYCLGGGMNPRALDRYDPVTDSWMSLPSMPEENINFRAVFCDGCIYTMGNGWFGSGSIFRYNIATQSWSDVFASLSGNRFHTTPAVIGGRIFIAGGFDPSIGGLSTACEELNTKDGSLIDRASMAEPNRLGLGVGFPATGKAYFIGGLNNQGITNRCFEFDPEAGGGTGAWTTRAPATIGGTPMPAFFTAGFPLGNRIYVTGGLSPTVQFQNSTLEYAPFRDLWSQRASMNVGRLGHAADAIAGRGYVYGGQSSVGLDIREEFIPPDFGSSPDLPAGVKQVGSQTSSSEQGGWTNNQIRFQTNINDPDNGQLVRLEVQVRPAGSASWGPVLSSGNQAQGDVSVAFTIPADGSYDWRWRIADAFDNYTPALNGLPQWVEAFGNTASPDFMSDQTPPAIPIALSPANGDVPVSSASGGLVTFTWVESTDNGPQSAISYEIQIARDFGFSDIEVTTSSTAGNSSFEIYVSVARTQKFWRIRARDIGGNLSAWSDSRAFRVTFDDRLNHAAGDAKKGCGFSATNSTAPLWTGALICLALLGMASGRRRPSY